MSYHAVLTLLDDFRWLAKGDSSKLQRALPDELARQLGYGADLDDAPVYATILPADYQQRAFQAYGEGDISLGRLAELLHIDPDAARALVDSADIRKPIPRSTISREKRRSLKREPR